MANTKIYPVSLPGNYTAIYTSLCVVNGNPAVAFAENGELYYWRASDKFGYEWDIKITIDFNPSNKGICMTLLSNGFPAISYYHNTGNSSRLMYIQAKDINGEKWVINPHLLVTFSSGTIITAKTSLVLINNNPAIIYFSNISLDIIIAKNANPLSADDWNTPIVITSITTGLFASFCFVGASNDIPAIAYTNQVNNISYLSYVYATDNTGTIWNDKIYLTETKQDPSLAMINGKPAITYAQSIIYADNTNGSSWGSSNAISSVPNDNPILLLTTDSSSNPMVYFTDYSNIYNSTFISSIWTPQNKVLITTAPSLQFISYAIIQNYPSIVTIDTNNNFLYFTRSSDNDGVNWGNPFIVDTDMVLEKNFKVSDKYNITVTAIGYGGNGGDGDGNSDYVSGGGGGGASETIELSFSNIIDLTYIVNDSKNNTYFNIKDSGLITTKYQPNNGKIGDRADDQSGGDGGKGGGAGGSGSSGGYYRGANGSPGTNGDYTIGGAGGGGEGATTQYALDIGLSGGARGRWDHYDPSGKNASGYGCGGGGGSFLLYSFSGGKGKGGIIQIQYTEIE